VLSRSMKTQIEMDRTGNVWIKSVCLRIEALIAHPWDSDHRKYYIEAFWGYSGD
jgi:hypothetical protein